MESALVPSRLLGELLIEKSLITPEELEEALAEQKETGKRLGEILVKKGCVSGPELTTVLAEQLGVTMEKQTGFGSGLWSEIKRRHPRGGRTTEAPEGSDSADPETPRETRLHLIDGLADAVGVMREGTAGEPAAEEPEPDIAVEGAPDLQPQLDALRQQLTFAGTRLNEERSAHEGTKRLLEEARAAQAEAEASGAAEQADPAELSELNDTIVSLRAELEARGAELAESVDARMELENVMAELESDLNELRERHNGSDAASAELADKVRELRVENDEVKRRLIESRAAAGAATDELAQLREDLAARDEARSREADARVAAEAALAELRAEAEALSQSLDEEKAAHVAARRDAERLESRCAELQPLEGQFAQASADLDARKHSNAELTAELAAAKAALEGARQAIERHEKRSAALAEDLEKARAELAERPEPPRVEEPPSAHIVFLPSAEGYALEARPGPAPEVGVEEELDGVHLRVARIGRSPLPADSRPCAFLEVA